MRWEEITPERWERDIDEAEHFYASLAKSYEGSGRMLFAITGCVSVSCKVTEDQNEHSVGSRLNDALRKA